MQERLTDFSRSHYDLKVAGQTLRLHAGRFAEWTEEKTLFIADAHLGKVQHFRRAGINLPGEAGRDTFLRLNNIINCYSPIRLIFLGDLFHSEYNEDFPLFAEWRKSFPNTEMWLIPGNHDRAGMSHLNPLGLRIEKPQKHGPFFLRHEPGKTEEGFLLCGHLHPSVSISGAGKQHIRIPAFWQSQGSLCLPAFGTFTGAARIEPDEDDVFFGVSAESLHRIPARLL